MIVYLLACFLQDLKTAIDDFREVVLLNFTAVLRYRTVPEHQLLEDTQVQLRSLHIAQLSESTHKNASSLAAVLVAAAVVGRHLLQLPE